jgi:hypothetical protein
MSSKNKPLSFNTLGEEQHLRREKGITQVINITQVIRFQASEITHVYLKLPLPWFLEVIPFTDHQTEVTYTVTTRHSDGAAGETPLGMQVANVVLIADQTFEMTGKR